jgi:Aspartyl protease/PDZ domain
LFSRRMVLGGLAAMPLLGTAAAQAPRVGGARILVRDNRVWMQVRFGGRGPYAFVIDTGAFTNLIRQDLARELGLRQLGDRTLRGVGGSHAMGLYEGRDVTLGGVSIGDADFAAYDYRDLRIHPEAMGALSTSILTVADADLDFGQSEWRIYPDGRGERSGYAQLPSAITRSSRTVGAAPIRVDVAIGDQSYRLQVDTGVPGQLLLYPGATRRSGLWNAQTPYAPQQRAGIGGVGAAGRLVRGPALRVGATTFERPLISLTDPDAHEGLPGDGLLGIGIIERLDWSTDVRAGKVWAKSSGLPARPERYGMSGLWTGQRGGRPVVERVSPGSPAAEAGLQPGDEIQGIGFGPFIARLSGAQGDRIEIDYRRSGTTHHTRLVLREFL